MIPERSGFTVDSTVRGTDVRMGIAADATQHLMGILTELYEDPELASIREYATNARDAHVEAGCAGRPIEVSTPTELRPTLTIRDYGTGLDLEDVRAIYSQYGASTKRSSNDSVGMLGLGCKSALAYADQFTLRAIKGGKLAVVSVARDEEGAGVMTVLEQGDTDEEDGVEVAIPARRHNQIASKAAEFFAHWAPGTVLVDGEAPAPAEGYRLADDLLVVDGDSLVVMGNVPYPADLDERVELPYGKGLVARVPIGSVQFTPSREALMDTPVTKRALAEIAGRFNAAKKVAVQRDVDTATTRGEAMARLAEAATSLGGNPKVTWRGEDVPHEIRPADGGSLRHVPVLRSWGPRNRSSTISSARAKLAGTATWIVNFSNSNWTKANRDKLMRYLDREKGWQDGEERDYLLVLGAEPPMADWLTEATVIDWADVRAWRDPDAPRGGGGNGGVKYAGTYPTYAAGKGYREWVKTYPASELAKVPAGKLFYCVGRIASSGGEYDALRELHGDDTVLVELSETRRAKFCRTFPEAKLLGDVMREAAEAWDAGLSDDERAALDERLNGWTELTALVPANLDDPELRRLVELAKLRERGDLLANYRKHGGHLSARPSGPVDKVMERYPLMPGTPYLTKRDREHVELYVNADYAAKQEDK
jgi:hypothetical protein